MDGPLDLNDLLIQNPAATFAVRIAGDSMTGAGMFAGDIAVVDRSRPSVVMERMILELQGRPCIGLEEVTPDRKSLIASRSFGRQSGEAVARR